MKKDSSGYVPSVFENSVRSDHAHFVAKYSKHKHCNKEPHEKCKISQDELSHKIKIATDFNVVNSMRCKNKVLALKNRYTVIVITPDGAITASQF